MKKIFGMFLWLAVTIALTGCIVDFTPKDRLVQIKPGESKTFKAVSDDPDAKLVWYLDKQIVASDTNTYTYTAEQNTSGKAIIHSLTVREEDGQYVKYYEMIGLPKGFMTSVTWTIKVPSMPTICTEGETRDTASCGTGACAAVGEETCTNGQWVVTSPCEPGAPSEEICDGIDNDCDGTADNNIPAVPSGNSCGVGICEREGELVCQGGQQVEVCTPGPAGPQELCGNGLDDNCDGLTDGEDQDACPIICTEGETRPTNCGVGACVSTGVESCVNNDWVATTPCEPGPPSAETCDGIDNDCDGAVDEDIAAVPTGETCGIGACERSEMSSCVNGELIASCTPGDPINEIDGNGIDDDCDGIVDEICTEGEVEETTCGQGACAATGQQTCINGQMVVTSECVPGDPTAEVCDGIDNDCDGPVDEDIAAVPTGENCGIGACERPEMSNCVDGELIASCTPGDPAPEVQDNGIDDDCDGIVDETCTEGEVEETTCGEGACAATGQQTCINGQMVVTIECVAGDPTAEVCDGIDNDCDGAVDEDIAAVPTGENCGIGACERPEISSCVDGELIASCTPGEPIGEIAGNGIDDNCDGIVDETCTEGAVEETTCGQGACAATGQLTCINGQPVVTIECVPGDPTAEVCDGIDNDCDGPVDEDIAATPSGNTCGTGACQSEEMLSCEDGALVPSCTPGDPTAEVCDGIDNDCDGEIDDGVLLTFYEDQDDDGYGHPAFDEQACTPSAGYVAQAGDCDDTNAAINPSAEEVCNGVDDNCNDAIDEGVTLTFYVDGDGDGYGTTATQQACAVGPGLSEVSTDCDDTNPTVNPGAEEVCDNGIDDNCNSEVDEDCGPIEPPNPPINVQATEADPTTYDPAHLDITVTWEDDTTGPAATYYQVYRHAWEEDGEYELVSADTGLTERSFVFSQNWQDDVIAHVGLNPAPLPEPDDIERQAFIANMVAYRNAILPYQMEFKSPTYFKVRACNEVGCSDFSAADLGQAEYLHTEAESEMASQFINAWGYPQLIALGDAPAGTAATYWCGIDVCGPGGGLVMGRLELVTSARDPRPKGAHIDVVYDNYTEYIATHPNSFAVADGSLSGVQAVTDAERNNMIFAGNFTGNLGGLQVGLEMYAHFNVDFGGYNTGWAAITYKGLTYQFTLPVNPQAVPVDGVYLAEPSVPIVPMDLSKPGWQASQAAYEPVPAIDDPYTPWDGCVRNADETVFPLEPTCLITP